MLPTWYPGAFFVAVVLGPLSHAAFWVRHEFDSIASRYVACFLLSQPLAVYSLLRFSDMAFQQAILTLWTAESIYWTSTLFSIAVCRLFLHPCRKFPGPFWARLSAFWRVQAFIRHQNRPYAEVYDLHQKYGDMVRLGPRNLSIRDVDAIPDIYGYQSGCVKGVQFKAGNMHSLTQLSDRDEHKARRKLFDQGLAPKQCQDFIPIMTQLIELFITKMKAIQGKPVAINPWMHYLTFDAMGQLALGSDYKQLETGREHEAIAAITKFLSATIISIHLPWLANLLMSMPGMSDPTSHLRGISAKALERREKETREHPDVMAALIVGREAGYPYPYPRSSLVDDVFILQVGGSDTTAGTLTILFYLLSKYPQVQSQLRQEITEAMPLTEVLSSWSKLAHLPFLEAVINETLRVWPVTPQGTDREIPLGEPLQIGPYLIPSGAAASVPVWSIHHDERYWEHPNEWIPERWTTRSELIKDKRAWFPFGMGRTSCVGKYFAMMEMKLFLAKVITSFDIEFAPGEDGSRVIDGHKDYFTLCIRI